MRAIILTLICLLFCALNALEAQCPKYDILLNEGRSNLKKSDYNKALLKFQAAQIAARECRTDSKEADDAIKKVFAALEKQRDDAIKAKKESEEQKKIAEDAKLETQMALSKAEKLINAFYFYDGKLALASKGSAESLKFGFINKDADEIIHYLYEKAEQFDNTGFAKVSRDNTDFLIDTQGNEFPVAYKMADLKTGITALDLRENKTDGFPKKIFNFKEFKILFLDSCQIDSLPQNIGLLKSLIYISLSHNKLSILPQSFGELISLHSLNLLHNSLDSLPREIGNLNSLQNLNLSSNNLNKLPDEIWKLKSLKVLKWGFDSVTNVPSQIGDLETLESLFLYGNPLSNLPPEIGKLKSLQNLYLFNNSLESLTREIGDLDSLKKMDLANNKLTELPVEIGNLKALKKLNLIGNNFSEEEKERIQKLLPDCIINF